MPPFNPFSPIPTAFPPMTPNPAQMSPSAGFFPNWSDFWNMASYFFGAQQGMARPIPGGFNVPYGTDPLTGILGDMSAPYLNGSRSFAYNTDAESLSRNISQIVTNVIATCGVHLNQNQIIAVKKAADLLATWGPSALGMAEQIIAADGDAGAAKTIVGGLRRGIEAVYGPGGPRMPMYSALNSIGGAIPLTQRDALFMNIMHQMAPVNGVLPGGYSYGQMASIMSSAASMGYNPLNSLNTSISKDILAQQIGDFAQQFSLDRESDWKVLHNAALQSVSGTFNKFSEVPTFGQAVYQAIENGSNDDTLAGSFEDNLQALNQAPQFFSLVNRLSRMDEFDKPINNFQTLFDQRVRLRELISSARSDERKNYLTSIVNDIDLLEKNFKGNRNININDIYESARNIQRAQLQRVVNELNIYAGEDEEDKQSNFIEAMLLQSELANYGITNLDELAEDEVDANGNSLGSKWKKLADKSNPTVQSLLNSYYGVGPNGGLHGLYTRTREELVSNKKVRMLEFIQAMQTATTDEARKKIIKDYSDVSEDAMNNLDFMAKAQQVNQAWSRLTRASSRLQTALANTGMPIEDERQLMGFINQITYGGLSTIDPERLARTLDQISVGMLFTGATGNDIMQMAGRGAQIAEAAGGDAQSGAIHAVQAGLAARAIAIKNNFMDPNRASELGARAAGRGEHSLVQQTYNAIAAFMYNKNVDVNNPYASLINKMKNNQTLSQEELDILYTQSAQIMSSVGMSPEEQHSYLNDQYTGASADAAARAGQAWMLNPTNVRLTMTDNIQHRLGISSHGQLAEDARKRIADAMMGSLSKIAATPEMLTDIDKAGDLVSMLPEDIQEELKKAGIDPVTAQRAMNHAVLLGAQRTGQSVADYLNSVRLQEGIQEESLNLAHLGVLESMMPDTLKSMWQGVSSVITSQDGTAAKLLQAVATSVGSGTFSDNELDTVFGTTAIASILNEKYEGATGLSPSQAEAARKSLNELYNAVRLRNDPKQWEMVNRYLMGDSSPEVMKVITSLKEEGLDPDTVKEFVQIASENVAKRVEEETKVVNTNLSGDQAPEEVIGVADVFTPEVRKPFTEIGQLTGGISMPSNELLDRLTKTLTQSETTEEEAPSSDVASGQGDGKTDKSPLWVRLVVDPNGPPLKVSVS